MPLYPFATDAPGRLYNPDRRFANTPDNTKGRNVPNRMFQLASNIYTKELDNGLEARQTEWGQVREAKQLDNDLVPTPVFGPEFSEGPRPKRQRFLAPSPAPAASLGAVETPSSSAATITARVSKTVVDTPRAGKAKAMPYSYLNVRSHILTTPSRTNMEY